MFLCPDPGATRTGLQLLLFLASYKVSWKNDLDSHVEIVITHEFGVVLWPVSINRSPGHWNHSGLTLRFPHLLGLCFIVCMERHRLSKSYASCTYMSTLSSQILLPSVNYFQTPFFPCLLAYIQVEIFLSSYIIF